MEEKRKKIYELVATVPEGVRIVSMLEFKGSVYLATEKSIYIHKGGVFTPLKIKCEHEIK